MIEVSQYRIALTLAFEEYSPPSTYCDLFSLSPDVERMDALRIYGNRHWSQLHHGVLREHTGILASFSIAAFVYFLPAYLVAIVEMGDLSMAWEVLYYLNEHDGNPLASNRWNSLTIPQSQCVVDMLGWLDKHNALPRTAALWLADIQSQKRRHH